MDTDTSQLQALTTEERSALVRKALQREDLSLCAFDDALAGRYSARLAIAEVLGLGADDRPSTRHPGPPAYSIRFRWTIDVTRT